MNLEKLLLLLLIINEAHSIYNGPYIRDFAKCSDFMAYNNLTSYCPGRNDSCYMNQFDTACYCDSFCTSDCCNDHPNKISATGSLVNSVTNVYPTTVSFQYCK